MYIAFLIATVTLLIPTLLPMLRHEAWWVRCFDFPRLQLCCLLLVLLLLELLVLDLREPVAIVLPVVAFACLGYQAWWILPYTRLFPVEVKVTKNRNSRNRIRLITANVLASNRNAEKLLEIVRTFDPDILVTLESNVWWQERLDILEEKYPFTIKCPSENLHSNHFTLAEIHRLPGFGSDHFPLLAELVLETGMRDQQEGLTGDRQDFQMTEEKARKEDVSERDVPEPDKKIN